MVSSGTLASCGVAKYEEGLIHITTFPIPHHFNERDLTLSRGENQSNLPCRSEIRIKVERADKMTGEIDFSYIPSEWDVVEKASSLKDD